MDETGKPVDIEAFVKDRLERWKGLLIQQGALPIALISVTPEGKGGTLHLVALENMPPKSLRDILKRIRGAIS